jgi:transcription antitermination factor NusG
MNLSPYQSGVMPNAWYAVYTRHQHEKSASNILGQKGFEVLLPLYRSLNRWKDRNKEVLLPLFPCYFFVCVDLERRTEVLRTPGVCWFVGNAATPVALPQHEVEMIRLIVATGVSVQPWPFLKCGDRVRVSSGPLAGVEGILTRIKNKCRVVVSVELLRQGAAVEVDLSILERVSSPRNEATNTSAALCQST